MKDKQGRGCAKTWVLKTGQNSQFWLQDTSVVCSYRKMEAYMNVKTKDCFFFMIHWQDYFQDFLAIAKQ